MTQPTLIRLEPNGPGGIGLSPLDLDPEDFQSELPSQGYYIYFEEPGIGLTVGIWETTSMQEAFGPYPGDEFIVVLEGAFAMIDGAGRGVPAQTSQAVAFRNGAPMSWMQAGYLKKFYLLLSDPEVPRPSLPDAEGAVIVADPSLDLTEHDREDDGWPAASGKRRQLFVNDAGNMHVNLRRIDAVSQEPSPATEHRFTYVLEGALTCTTQDGRSEQFGPGDVFFVPRGLTVSWKTSGSVRLIEACVR